MGEISALAMPDPGLLAGFAANPTQGGDAFNAGVQGAQQQILDRNALAVQLQQAAQQRAAQQAYVANPTAQNFNTLIAYHPEIAQQIKTGFDALNTDQQNQTLRDWSALQGLLVGGNKAAALQRLQDRISADTAAGRPTTDDQEAYDTLNAGDADHALAFVNAHIAAAKPDKFSDTEKDLGSEARANAEQPGKQALTAAQTAQANAAANKDKFLTVSNAEGGQDVLNIGGAPGAAPATSGAPGAPAGAAATGPQPRGVRNNNPVNVTNLGGDQKWAGQTGSDGAYATFATPEAGMAAADKNLQAYGTKHGIDTIAGVIQRWAPPSDNDTASYIATVAKATGIDPNQKINLKNPNVRQKLLTAMSGVELGQPGAGGALTGGAAGDTLATGDQPQLGPGVSVAYKAATDGGGGLLSPESVAMVGQQYLSLGPSALQNLGQGKVGVMNKNRIMNWAANMAKEAGTSNPQLVARFAQNKANVEALGQNTKALAGISASASTLEANLDFAQSLAARGLGPTGVPLLDLPINKLRSTLGSADAKTLDNVLTTSGDEYARILSSGPNGGGNATSDAAKSEAHKLINNGMTLRQLTAAINAAKVEATNRKAAYAAEGTRLTSEISGVPTPPSAPASAAPGAGAAPAGWSVRRVK